MLFAPKQLNKKKKKKRSSNTLFVTKHWGKWAFSLIFKKYLAQCLCFETIVHCVLILKLDFLKI